MWGHLLYVTLDYRHITAHQKYTILFIHSFILRS